MTKKEQAKSPPIPKTPWRSNTIERPPYQNAMAKPKGVSEDVTRFEALVESGMHPLDAATRVRGRKPANA